MVQVFLQADLALVLIFAQGSMPGRRAASNWITKHSAFCCCDTARAWDRMSELLCELVLLAASYMDGELPGSAERSYEEHFIDCGDCLCAVERQRAKNVDESRRGRVGRIEIIQLRPGSRIVRCRPSSPAFAAPHSQCEVRRACLAGRKTALPPTADGARFVAKAKAGLRQCKVQLIPEPRIIRRVCSKQSLYVHRPLNVCT
jgi:hypothetical protein